MDTDNDPHVEVNRSGDSPPAEPDPRKTRRKLTRAEITALVLAGLGCAEQLAELGVELFRWLGSYPT